MIFMETKLQNVPYKNRTLDVCYRSAIDDPKNIHYIPEYLKTQDFFDRVFSQSLGPGYNHTPVTDLYDGSGACILISKETFKKLVLMNEYNYDLLFQTSPSVTRDVDLHMELFDKYYVMKQFFCKFIYEYMNHKDVEKLSMKAIAKHNNALAFIPNFYLTREIIEKCLEDHPLNFRYLPEVLMTEKHIENVLEKFKTDNESNVTLTTLTYSIPERLYTYEIFKSIVDAGLVDISHIPKKFLTNELCKKYYKNSRILRDIPSEILTYDWCLEAVKDYVYNIKYIPDRCIVRDIKTLKETIEIV